jgi:ribonuclease T1
LIFQGYPVSLVGRALPGQFRKAVLHLGLAVLLASGSGVGGGAAARTPGSPAAVAPITWSALPPEAQGTHQLIRSGGPFPYRKDGSVFGNRERLLPLRDRGHYREYTVRTPGSPDRGARRIVCGGKPPTSPEACYYTADHYASFRRIVTPMP